MLGVPLRMPHSCDWQRGLSQYISSQYSPDEQQAVSRGVQEVHALRNKLCISLTTGAQDSLSAIDTFTHYYKLLQCIMTRFPCQTSNSPPPPSNGNFVTNLFQNKKLTHLSMQFTWFEAFSHKQSVSDSDMNLEKNSILFNLGALYSRHATQLKASAVGPGLDTQLKESCRFFQMAAGVFSYLSTNVELVSPLLAGSPLTTSFDLCSDTTGMLSTLMLAQAQACFFEKATTTASPKLIAKLSQGVADLFRDAKRMCDRSAKFQQFLKKPDVYPWCIHAHYQMLCYIAAANFWHAKHVFTEQEAYGTEIAYLEKARSILQLAKQSEQGLLKNLSDNRYRLESAITARLNAAIRENESIYYQPVPKIDSLTEVESIISVKCIPFDWPVDLTIDPFATLISPGVRDKSTQFTARLNELKSNFTKRITERQQQTDAQLQEWQLPASIESREVGNAGIPDAVWDKIREIQLKGGVNQFNELNARIESSVREAESMLNSINDSLTKERDADKTYRAQFLHRWNRRPSEQLSVDFQKQCESIQQYLASAAASNATVRTEWQKLQSSLAELELSKAELEAKLPRVSLARNQEVEAIAAKLKELLIKLKDNSTKRSQILCDFELKQSELDIQALVLSSPSSSSPVSSNTLDSEYASFVAFSTAFDACDSSETALLDEIRVLNAQYSSIKSMDEVATRRQAVVQEWNGAINGFNKLLANFNEGCKFYADLLNTKLIPLRRNVDDYVIARDMESRIILEQLTKDITQSYGASASSLPPSANVSSSLYPSPSPSLPSPSPSPSPSSASASLDASASTGAPVVHNPNLQYDVPPHPVYASMQVNNPAGPFAYSNAPAPIMAQPSAYNMYAPSPYAPSAAHPSSPHLPPPQPAAASTANQLSCSRCTFLNSPANVKCDMCHSPLM